MDKIKNKKDKADADFVIAWIFGKIGDVHFSLNKYKGTIKPYFELKDTSKQARPISGTSPQDTGGGGNTSSVGKTGQAGKA